jgi:hypothetical protein
VGGIIPESWAASNRNGGRYRSESAKIGTGTIIDATIIAAPSSTKNEDGTRDPEMHQTKKGDLTSGRNLWRLKETGCMGIPSFGSLQCPETEKV